jgi:hypothetical protein
LQREAPPQNLSSNTSGQDCTDILWILTSMRSCAVGNMTTVGRFQKWLAVGLSRKEKLLSDRQRPHILRHCQHPPELYKVPNCWHDQCLSPVIISKAHQFQFLELNAPIILSKKSRPLGRMRIQTKSTCHLPKQMILQI